MRVKSPFKLHIPKRSRLCKGCECPFHPDARYCSLLRSGEEEGEFLREDYCDSCWEEKQVLLEGARSHWRARVPVKQEREEPQEPLDRLLSLLRESHMNENEEDKASAFLLSLILLRKKRIFLRKEMEIGGVKTAIYEIPETEEMIPIPFLHPTQEQVASFQERLAELTL